VAAISPVVAAEVRAVLVDRGFYSAAAVAAVEQKPDGTASGLTVYAAVEKTSHHKTVAALLPPPEPPAPGPEATAKVLMAHRLKTAVGQALYRLRKQTVEPVFGIIKEVMGFRRFRRRGRAKVALEWTLVCVSDNLKRLFTLKNLAAAGYQAGAGARGAKNRKTLLPNAGPSWATESQIGFVPATGARNRTAPAIAISKSDKFLATCIGSPLPNLWRSPSVRYWVW